MVVLRRIKDKVRMPKQKKKLSLKNRRRVLMRQKATVSGNQKKEVLGVEETVIEQAKFYASQAPRAQRIELRELPSKYGQDKIVLQVRDPWWLHAYWEVRDDTLTRLRNEFKDEFYKARTILRVYDVSNIIFDGKNAHRFFDIHINEYTNNWYIDTAGSGRSWCVELGLLFADSRFIAIVRSNTVQTPLEGPSWITDEEWMVPEEMFARLYGMGFGFGRTSPIGKAWQERLKRALFSGVLASGGITSVSSPAKKISQERKFWLIVNTELIVYGATEPDAKVSVQGRAIKIRPDGTFTLRFALPDGKQVIPVKAVSSDNQEERTITPIVNKETK